MKLLTLVAAVASGMTHVQHCAMSEVCGQEVISEASWRLHEEHIKELISLVLRGMFSVVEYKGILLIDQPEMDRIVQLLRPTWSTVSPQYKAAERKAARGCMIEGFEYDMYVGWMDSFATVHGKPFVRMPRGMYNLEMDKLGK